MSGVDWWKCELGCGRDWATQVGRNKMRGHCQRGRGCAGRHQEGVWWHGALQNQVGENKFWWWVGHRQTRLAAADSCTPYWAALHLVGHCCASPPACTCPPPVEHAPCSSPPTCIHTSSTCRSTLTTPQPLQPRSCPVPAPPAPPGSCLAPCTTSCCQSKPRVPGSAPLPSQAC